MCLFWDINHWFKIGSEEWREIVRARRHGQHVRVDIEYKLKIVFVVWFGTHTEYDKIDVKKVRYEN